MWRNRPLVAVAPVRDLLLCAKHLFVDARASGGVEPGPENRHHHATKVQYPVVNLHSTWSDERTIADTYWSQPLTDNTASGLAFRVMPAGDGTTADSCRIRLGDTMTKPKTCGEPPPHQPITLMDLVAEARAVDWDFATWCHVSGYDASDQDARSMFECLLAYARREGRAGLH
jgi:hypothetical protein